MKAKILTGVALVCGLANGASTYAINVLWYTGGTESSGAGSYISAISGIEAQEENPIFNVSGSVNPWTMTFWTGGAMPAGAFDVLVVASPQGGWSSYPDYTALHTDVAIGDLGDRVMLTGQDADWHYINFPGSALFNNPSGFLIDAINWAGSGSGMGAVFLGEDGSNSQYYSGVGSFGSGSDSVNIPPAYASFPINAGLTSAGISSWSTSSHTTWTGTDTTQWTGINTAPGGAFVTLVSAATAGGGTTAPDGGATMVLLGIGTMVLGSLRARRS